MVNLKITFIVYYEFSKRDYDRFGVETLKGNGYDVTVLVIKNLFEGNATYKNISNSLGVEIICIENFSQFTEYFQSLKPVKSIVFLGIGFSTKFFSIYKFLSTCNILWGIVRTNTIPREKTSSEWFEKVKLYLYFFRLKSIFNYIKYLTYKSFNLYRPFDFVILGGSNSKKMIFNTGANTHNIWTHAMDYDLYLSRNEQRKWKKEDPYIVFIDDMMIGHPDSKNTNRSLLHVKDMYFKKMNDFFDMLEDLYMPVVIAAHPRADYYTTEKVWKEREVVFDSTIELIEKASFCITHSSTAINFSVLYKKPLMFVSTFEIDKRRARFIEPMAESLNKKKVFVENVNKNIVEKNLNVDPIAYNDYIQKYIKVDGTPNHYLWEIVSKEFKYMQENKKWKK